MSYPSGSPPTKIAVLVGSTGGRGWVVMNDDDDKHHQKSDKHDAKLNMIHDCMTQWTAMDILLVVGHCDTTTAVVAGSLTRSPPLPPLPPRPPLPPPPPPPPQKNMPLTDKRAAGRHTRG